MSLMESKSFNDRTVNFSEKIIFVIDTVRESNATLFKLGTGATYSSLYMIKRVIEIFLHNKKMLNEKHEFAIMTLDSQKAHWICDFTGNLEILLNKLESLEETTMDIDKRFFDIQQAFSLVHQKVIDEAPLLQDNPIRIIILYSRSNIIPICDIEDKHTQELITNSNCFVDILYVHETPSLENKCKEIYTQLSKYNIRNVSYILEVSRNAMKLHNYMARLLAHPLQRAPQKDLKSNIHPAILAAINQENKTNN